MKKLSNDEIKKLDGFPQLISELKGIHNRFDYGIVVNALYEFKNLQVFLDDSEIRHANEIATRDCAKEIIKRRNGEVSGKIDIIDYARVREGQLISDYYSRIRNGISTLGESTDKILYAIISRHDYGKDTILSEYTLEAFTDSADVATEISEYIMSMGKHNDVLISVVGRSRNFNNQSSEMGN